MIYFVQAEGGGPIKIGFTSHDPHDRLKGLQTAHARRLRVTCSLPGDRQDEQALHRLFAAARMGGEWFMPVPALARLAKAAATPPPSLDDDLDDELDESRAAPPPSVRVTAESRMYHQLVDLFAEISEPINKADAAAELGVDRGNHNFRAAWRALREEGAITDTPAGFTQSSERAPRRREAEDFIVAELHAHGPLRWDDLEQRAVERELASKTLRNARDGLRTAGTIEKYKEQVQHGGWFWRLKVAADADAAPLAEVQSIGVAA